MMTKPNPRTGLWLASATSFFVAFTSHQGYAGAQPAPYYCYPLNTAVWGAVEAVHILAYETPPGPYAWECAGLAFRPTDTPGSCYMFTAPYTDLEEDTVSMEQPTIAALAHGSKRMIADVHNHPAYHSPAGFSDDDLDEPDLNIPILVLLEDLGLCVRIYDRDLQIWPVAQYEHDFGTCR